jgi:hypothetical protein
MYCPRCSQQQVSDVVSFCSRCGFQLDVVRELLVTDGTLPARAIEFRSSSLSPGRNGARLGAKLIFFSLISLPVFFALSAVNDSPGPLLPPAVTFLIGLTFVLYARIFGEDILPSKRVGIVGMPKLPLHVGTPRAELGAMRVDTAEMVQPPSITEHTTNLL